MGSVQLMTASSHLQILSQIQSYAWLGITCENFLADTSITTCVTAMACMTMTITMTVIANAFLVVVFLYSVHQLKRQWFLPLIEIGN